MLNAPTRRSSPGIIARLADVCHEVAETDERRAYTVCGLIVPVRFAEYGQSKRVNCHECRNENPSTHA
jgi:hypothetical protein